MEKPSKLEEWRLVCMKDVFLFFWLFIIITYALVSALEDTSPQLFIKVSTICPENNTALLTTEIHSMK